jgi:hypothetical protein
MQAAHERDLGERKLCERAVLVVEEQLDLAVVGRRAILGARLPAAQSSASEMFDLPEPFGPTTTATPRSSRTSTGSGKDLKPRSFIARRCTRDESLTRR